MTVRDIQGHLLELYGIEVLPDLVRVVTDAVLEPVAEWQNRAAGCALSSGVLRCLAGQGQGRRAGPSPKVA